MLKKKYEDSILSSASSGADNYDYFNSLYEKTFNKPQNSGAFDLEKEKDRLSIKTEDYDSVFGEMYRKAEAELGLSKEKYATNPLNTVESRAQADALNKNLLAPNGYKEPVDLSLPQNEKYAKEVEKINKRIATYEKNLTDNNLSENKKAILQKRIDTEKQKASTIASEVKDWENTQRDKEWYKKIPYLSELGAGALINAPAGITNAINEKLLQYNEKELADRLKYAEKALNKEGITAEEKTAILKEIENIKADGQEKIDGHLNRRENLQKVIDYGKEFQTTDPNASAVERITKGVASSFGNMAFNASFGSGTLVAMGVSSYGTAMDEGRRELNLKDEDLERYALMNGAIEAGSELIGGSAVLKAIQTKGIKAFGKEAAEQIAKDMSQGSFKTYLKEIGKEYGQEAMTEVAHIINEGTFKDKDGNSIGVKDFAEALKRTNEAGLAGALMGGVASSGNLAGAVKNKSVKDENSNFLAPVQPVSQDKTESPLAPVQPVSQTPVNNQQFNQQAGENTENTEDFKELTDEDYINNAFGFEITPKNPEAPFVERIENVYIKGDGSTINASLIEAMAEEQGLKLEELTQFTPEQTQERQTLQEQEIIKQETENTIGAIEQSVTENGVEATLKTLSRAEKQGQIDEATFNTAVEYINNLNEQTKTEKDFNQQSPTDSNAKQQDLSQINSTAQEITQKDTPISQGQVKLHSITGSSAFQKAYNGTKLTEVPKLSIEQKNAVKLSKTLNKEVVFYNAEGQAPNGFYKDNTIFISADKNGNSIMQVLGHETFHSLEKDHNKIFKELVNWGVDNFTAKEIEDYLAKIPNEKQVEILSNNPKLLSEEMLADAFGNDFANKDFWNKLKDTNKTLFDKIKEVIAKIFNKAEKTETDYLTKKHIIELRAKFDSILGDLSGITTEEVKEAPKKALKTEEVKSVEAPKKETENDIRFSTRQTETPEFKKWFKDSKVVDENGKPLVVYHGTPNGRFWRFKETKKSNSTHETRKLGFYFTEDFDTASDFTQNFASMDEDGFMAESKKPKVYETYLSLQNPYIYDMEYLKDEDGYVAGDFYDLYYEKKNALGLDDGEMSKADRERIKKGLEEATPYIRDYENGNLDFKDPFRILSIEAQLKGAKEFRQELINNGYDGIIVRDTGWDLSSESYSKGKEELQQIVAFYPNQIKSATGNNGDFDANNDDIRFSAREEVKGKLNEILEKVDNKQLRKAIQDKTGIVINSSIDIKGLIDKYIGLIAKYSNLTRDKQEGRLANELMVKDNCSLAQAKAIASYVIGINKALTNTAETSSRKDANAIKVSNGHKKKVDWKEKTRTIYSRTVDKYEFLKDISTEAYETALNSHRATAMAETIMTQGLYSINGDYINISAQELFNTAFPQNNEEYFDFIYYMSRKDDIDRARNGQNTMTDKEGKYFTEEQNIAFVEEQEAKHPKWKDNSEKIYEWQQDLLYNYAVKTGLISEERFIDIVKKHRFYIPKFRVEQDPEAGKDLYTGNFTGASFVNKANPVKTAKGGDLDLLDFREGILNNIENTVKTAVYNEVGQEVLKAVRRDSDLKDLVSIVPESRKDGNTVSVMENGNKVFIKVKDTELMRALKNVTLQGNPTAENAFVRFSRNLNNVRKKLITVLSPFFMLTNTPRDAGNYFFKFKGTKRQAFEYAIRAFNEMRTKGDYWELLEAVGADSSGLLKQHGTKQVEELTGKKAVVNEEGSMLGFRDAPTSLKTIQNAMDFLEFLGYKVKKTEEGLSDFTSFTEQMWRLGAFIYELDNGGNARTATRAAAEITTDFSKSGDIIKVVDAFVMFLNAGVQGMDNTYKQLLRNETDTDFIWKDKKKLARNLQNAFTYFILPTILQYALIGAGEEERKEEYEAITDRVKDSNWIIPNYFSKDKGSFIKIPKSREYGTLISAPFQRIIEGRGYKGYATTLLDNIAPENPLTNNTYFEAGKMFLEDPKDFLGRSIIPAKLADLKAGDQTDKNTTVLATALGKITNISPKKIDYTLDQWTGFVGDILMPMLTADYWDSVENSSGKDIAGKVLQPLTSRISTNTSYSNQASTDFYDYKKQLSQIIASEQKGMNTEEKKATTTEGELVLKQIKDQSDYIAEINTALKESGLSEADKRYLRRQKNAAMKDANTILKQFLAPKKR